MKSKQIKMTITLGDNSRCGRADAEWQRERSRLGLRNRIYARTLILPIIGKDTCKDLYGSMSRVPLIASERNVTENDPRNMVRLEAGIPGDTWSYCIERERLAQRSEWFRAMLMGPLAPAPSDPPPLVQLQHVEKRAFDHLLRYLHDEPINFQSVSTARATLDAAHQYLCPGLARLAVDFLDAHLNPFTVLEIYQGLSLYACDSFYNSNRSTPSPTAPPYPGDDAGHIAMYCTTLLQRCFSIIDSEPTSVLSQERFEELSPREVAGIVFRDTLRLADETVLFRALERWTASECRRQGLEPTPANRRAALDDDVWFSVRYLLMTDKEFIEGPMASGVLTSEESAFIVSRILGIREISDNEELQLVTSESLQRLSSTPRIGTRSRDDLRRSSKPGKRERQDNRKNRRKECATQGQKTCARIGNCLVRVLACVFD